MNLSYLSKLIILSSLIFGFSLAQAGSKEPRVVVLVHGLLGDSKSFCDLENMLEPYLRGDKNSPDYNPNIHVITINYATSSPTDNVAQFAAEMGDQLQTFFFNPAIKPSNPRFKDPEGNLDPLPLNTPIDFIVHSQGGLVVNTYADLYVNSQGINRGSYARLKNKPYPKNIQRVISLGSPFWGSPIASGLGDKVDSHENLSETGALIQNILVHLDIKKDQQLKDMSYGSQRLSDLRWSFMGEDPYGGNDPNPEKISKIKGPFTPNTQFYNVVGNINMGSDINSISTGTLEKFDTVLKGILASIPLTGLPSAVTQGLLIDKLTNGGLSDDLKVEFRNRLRSFYGFTLERDYDLAVDAASGRMDFHYHIESETDHSKGVCGTTNIALGHYMPIDDSHFPGVPGFNGVACIKAPFPSDLKGDAGPTQIDNSIRKFFENPPSSKLTAELMSRNIEKFYKVVEVIKNEPGKNHISALSFAGFDRKAQNFAFGGKSENLPKMRNFVSEISIHLPKGINRKVLDNTNSNLSYINPRRDYEKKTTGWTGYGARGYIKSVNQSKSGIFANGSTPFSRTLFVNNGDIGKSVNAQNYQAYVHQGRFYGDRSYQMALHGKLEPGLAKQYGKIENSQCQVNVDGEFPSDEIGYDIAIPGFVGRNHKVRVSPSFTTYSEIYLDRLFTLPSLQKNDTVRSKTLDGKEMLDSSTARLWRDSVNGDKYLLSTVTDYDYQPKLQKFNRAVWYNLKTNQVEHTYGTQAELGKFDPIKDRCYRAVVGRYTQGFHENRAYKIFSSEREDFPIHSGETVEVLGRLNYLGKDRYLVSNPRIASEVIRTSSKMGPTKLKGTPWADQRYYVWVEEKDIDIIDKPAICNGGRPLEANDSIAQ